MSPRASRSPSPSPSPSRVGLCQPFPDRLIDDFLRFYNGESGAIETLVVDERIEDVVASAYSGQSSFAGAAEWAEAGWNEGDRLRSSGYSAFHPTKRGFQMHLTRWSRALRDEGIDAISMTLDAISHGCSIEHLEMSGDVQSKPEACAFYDAFGHIAAVAANEPEACRDGSGQHARSNHVAVWTGDKALVWGGTRGGLFVWPHVALDGFEFTPDQENWQPVREPTVPDFVPEVGAWTGSELIVFGGQTRPNYRVVGAAYDPTAGRWRILNFPYPKWSGFEAVWTGTELLLWGSPRVRNPSPRGAAYNPLTDTWRPISRAPIGGRWWHSLIWTGTEMIVWGGSDENTDLADGAAYDPVADTWRKIAPAPISARQWLPLVWTGSEMIVWGGSSYSKSQSDGAAYDPVNDSWRKLAPAPLRPRHYHSATWTGTEMIVFGGHDYGPTYRDGAAYDPVTDTWRKIARPSIAPRFSHTAVWTGDELFVFGGTEDFGHLALGDGALYDSERDRWRRVIPRL